MLLMGGIRQKVNGACHSVASVYDARSVDLYGALTPLSGDCTKGLPSLSQEDHLWTYCTLAARPARLALEPRRHDLRRRHRNLAIIAGLDS